MKRSYKSKKGRTIHRRKSHVKKRSHPRAITAAQFSPWGQYLGSHPFSEHINVSSKFTHTNVVASATTVNTYGTEEFFYISDLWACGVNGGTALQPAWVSTLNTIYGQYRVYAVDFKLTFAFPEVNSTGVSANNLYTTVKIVNSFSGATLTGGTVDTETQIPESYGRYLSATGSQKVVYKRRFDIAAIEGLNKSKYWGDVRYDAATGASPVKQPKIHFAVANTDTGTALSCNYTIELIYHAKFWARQLLF